MIAIMEAEDKAEVRQMLLDIMGTPLSELNGQMKLLVNQNANIELQTLKTNGRVNALEDWQLEVVGKLAAELPHHIEACPQTPTLAAMQTAISEIKTDVNTIKTAKGERTKFRETLRANIGTILVGIGILVTIALNLSNRKSNRTQIVNQNDLKSEIHQILKEDSTLIYRSK